MTCRETYAKVNGVWQHVYRAIDQYGQVIDVSVSAHRDADAARRSFRRALSTLKVKPNEVVTDAAAVYPIVLDELMPSAGEEWSSARLGKTTSTVWCNARAPAYLSRPYQTSAERDEAPFAA